MLVFQRELRRAGLPGDAINAALAGVLGGLAGAKLIWAIEFRDTAPFLELVLSRGGLSWFGGLAGGLVAGLAALRGYGVPLVRGLAAASPALALGHAIGRVGCFPGRRRLRQAEHAAVGRRVSEGAAADRRARAPHAVVRSDPARRAGVAADPLAP